MNIMCNILLTVVGLWSLLIGHTQCAVQYMYTNSTKDTSIQSENYPRVYPINSNVTWVYETTRGFWGVFFRDFDLSHDDDFTDGGDWLRIESDREGDVTTYTYASRTKHQHYVSKSPRLVINFMTDDKKDESSIRGFDLQILFGNSEREVRLKLHEADKRQEKEKNNDSSSFILIVTITFSVLALVLVVVICTIKLKAGKRVKSNDDRDAFGVRRGSGVRHSRHGSSTSPPQTPDEINAPVQPSSLHDHRQNSHLGWMARAERSNSLNTSKRNRNVESNGNVLHAINGPKHHGNAHSNNIGPVPDPHVAHQSACKDSWATHGSDIKEMQQVFECVSDKVGKCRDTSHSFRFTSDLEKKHQKAACGESLSCSNSASGKQTNTYISNLNDRNVEETCRKYCFQGETDEFEDDRSLSGPPSYESLIEAAGGATGVQVGCYDNVVDAQYYSNTICSDYASSGIYINAMTNSLESESDCNHGMHQRGSPLREHTRPTNTPAIVLQAPSEYIVTDYSSSSIMTHGDLPTLNSIGPVNHDLLNDPAQVCFYDGYAYIIPQSGERTDSRSTRAALNTHQRDGPYLLTIVPDGVRASKLANEGGYIDMFTGTEQRLDNIYTNDVAQLPTVHDNMAVTFQNKPMEQQQ